MAKRPTMVLLHAFPLHSGLFAGVTMPAGWAVRTPDRRGFGGTPLAGPGSPVPPPSLDVLVDDVIRGLDESGADRAVIGGVSMGGYVALALLAAHPDRVAGLVLADTRSTVDRAAERDARLAMAAAADGGEVPSGADLVAPLLGPDAPAAVRDAMAAMAAQAPAASIAWAQRAMAGRADTTAAMAAADVPALVIVGGEDRVTPPAAAWHMAETARRATLVEIPGVGHLTPAEAPDRFAAALAEWTARWW